MDWKKSLGPGRGVKDNGYITEKSVRDPWISTKVSGLLSQYFFFWVFEFPVSGSYNSSSSSHLFPLDVSQNSIFTPSPIHSPLYSLLLERSSVLLILTTPCIQRIWYVQHQHCWPLDSYFLFCILVPVVHKIIFPCVSYCLLTFNMSKF